MAPVWGRFFVAVPRAGAAVIPQPAVAADRRKNMSAASIPALTLHQPWATLIALGIKTIETRSWPPPRAIIGRRLAIHAGRAIDPNPAAVVAALRAHYGQGWPGAIPKGAVVACATVKAARQVAGADARRPRYVRTKEGPVLPVDPYGDFSVGRWLWLLDDVAPLEPPAPASGRQRIWYWTPPPP